MSDTGDTFDPDRDRMECCGRWAHEGHAPGCDNAPIITGCRLCDALGEPCEEHAFQLLEERREWNADRFIEALLGARLRFHADPSGNANVPPAYWMRVYGRWQELYRDGLSREGAYRV
jgi:hypothetical protein